MSLHNMDRDTKYIPDNKYYLYLCFIKYYSVHTIYFVLYTLVLSKYRLYICVILYCSIAYNIR